jgi:hypothetical protein
MGKPPGFAQPADAPLIPTLLAVLSDAGCPTTAGAAGSPIEEAIHG